MGLRTAQAKQPAHRETHHYCLTSTLSQSSSSCWYCLAAYSVTVKGILYRMSWTVRGFSEKSVSLSPRIAWVKSSTPPLGGCARVSLHEVLTGGVLKAARKWL